MIAWPGLGIRQGRVMPEEGEKAVNDEDSGEEDSRDVRLRNVRFDVGSIAADNRKFWNDQPTSYRGAADFQRQLYGDDAGQ